MPLAPVAYEAPTRAPRASYDQRVRATLAALGSENPEAEIETTGGLERWKKAKIDPATAAASIYTTARHRHPPTSVLAVSESPTREEWEVIVRKGSVDKIVDTAGRKPDGVEGQNVIFGDFYDDEKAANFARRLMRAGFVTFYRPRPKEAAEPGHRSSSTAAEDSAPCTQVSRTIDGDCAKLAKEIGPIRSDRELYRLIAPSMKKETQEVFQVICIDVHGDLVGYTEVARGQVSRVAVDIEDVLGAVLAIRPRPTAFAVAHVHPSGKARPSQADRKLTEEIRSASRTALPNTVFMDHIVVGGGSSNEYFSFTDNKIKRA
jgi:proteasome lid subunit RPN8/RPN11